MQKKQLSVLVLIILCFLLGCNRETPKDESQQNYEDESNISKTNGEELVNINSELLGSTPFDIQIDKTALQTRKETETEVTIKTNLTDWGYTVSSEKGKISDINKNSLKVRTAVLLVWKKFPRMSSIRFSSIPGSKQGTWNIHSLSPWMTAFS